MAIQQIQMVSYCCMMLGLVGVATLVIMWSRYKLGMAIRFTYRYQKGQNKTTLSKVKEDSEETILLNDEKETVLLQDITFIQE